MQNKKPIYRLYVDESGDHTYKSFEHVTNKHLCLTGIAVKRLPDYYNQLDPALESLKMDIFNHDPDEKSKNKVILHRTDIINKRGPFKVLLDNKVNEEYEVRLLQILEDNSFLIISVVLNKESYYIRMGETGEHFYHYCLRALLERYCGYLNHISSCGDVLLEKRGKEEDKLLVRAYNNFFDGGSRYIKPIDVQRALTSRKPILRGKWANITGLQIADVLAHPIKQQILTENNSDGKIGNFANKILIAIDPKFNRQIYNNYIQGYGKIYLK